MLKEPIDVRKVQALIKVTLSTIEESELNYEVIRKLVIRIAFDAYCVGLNSSAKSG